MKINHHPDLDPILEAIGLPYWGIGIVAEQIVRGQSHANDKGATNSVPDGSLLVVGICSPYRTAQKYAYHPEVNQHLSYIEPFSWEVDYHVEVRKELALVQRRVEPYLLSRGILSGEEAARSGRNFCSEPEFGVDNTDNDDRAIAVAMGLGKLGRNHLVLHPKLGSHFFIGYMLYTNFDWKRTVDFLREGSVDDFELICERCGKCVAACPTRALSQGVEYCLSYLTQFTGDVPEEKRGAFRNRLYGCSECQRVCPYNRMEPGIAGSYVDPFQILTYTNKTFKQDYGHMGFAWRTLRVYKRNALINLGNMGDAAVLQRLMEIRAGNDANIKIPDNLMQYLDWAMEEIKKRIN